MRAATPATYRAGQALLHQGQQPSQVHILTRGRVTILRTTHDGHEILLALRGPGDTLGELAALDPAPHVATANAIDEVSCLTLPADTFRTFVHHHPKVLAALVQLLARRLREADRRLVEARTEDVLTRLSRHLLELGARYGRAGEAGLDLDIPLSQEQLAAWIGTTRESVSLALGELRGRQAVMTARRRVTLVDVDVLRELATGSP